MNWLEKVKFLREAKYDPKYKSYFVDISTEDNNWAEGEFERLTEGYDYLPESYKSFIKELDNLGLAFVVFYGSKAGDVIPLEEELEYWSEIFGKEYFSFGKDADGSIFTFNKKGEVIYFSRDDFDCENPIKIANSFEEFVGDYLIGKRFGDANNPEKINFYKFLKHMGWV